MQVKDSSDEAHNEIRDCEKEGFQKEVADLKLKVCLFKITISSAKLSSIGSPL